MDKTLAQFHTARYDADLQAVTRLAKDIQIQNPSMTWTECIIEAEKIIKVR